MKRRRRRRRRRRNTPAVEADGSGGGLALSLTFSGGEVGRLTIDPIAILLIFARVRHHLVHTNLHDVINFSSTIKHVRYWISNFLLPNRDRKSCRESPPWRR